MILHELNESQKTAVTTTEGPLLIIAGPGTGKTLTLTSRIAYLIRQGVKPENILAVTFTNRAAREMRDRTELLLGSDSAKIFIGTFHLLGLSIIQNTLSNSFVIYSREEQAGLLKIILKDSGKKVQPVLEKISSIKSCLEDAGDELKAIYEEYQAALMRNSALDFDDLILKPIDIITNSEISERYKDRFKYIMVDEYQDINPAQYKLLMLLAQDNANICAIGDSDQAIYAFRGADVTNFLNFEKDFRNTKRITMTENYRSTGVILDASNKVIKNNRKRIAKEIKAVRGKGFPLTVISVPDEQTEGEIIIGEIEKRIGGTSHYRLMRKVLSSNPSLEKGGRGNFDSEYSFSFSDFAIIFRTNAQAKAIEKSFTESGIPFQVIGKAHMLKRNYIDELRKRLTDLNAGLSFDEWCKTILEESGLYNDSDIIFLQNLASQYRNLEPSEALVGFINELSLMTPADAFNPKADAVTLMTLHMAKGLEFRVVFITGVEEGLIPYTMKKDGIDIEEERRLFYVGMTRAMDELFLIHARKRFLYGQKLVQSPSPFLGEIPGEFINFRVIPDKIKRPEKNQIGLF